MLKITAIGNLTNDVVLRTGENSDKPYAILRIASDRRYRAPNGGRRTDFISIKVRGALAVGPTWPDTSPRTLWPPGWLRSVPSVSHTPPAGPNRWRWTLMPIRPESTRKLCWSRPSGLCLT